MDVKFAIRKKIVALQNKARPLFNPKFNQEKFERERAENLIISLPCCGRTWLRVMIGLVLKSMKGKALAGINPQSLFLLYQLAPEIPSIKASHEHFLGKDRYLEKRVILLTRDPRGALLSYIKKAIKRGEKKWIGYDFSYILHHSNYLEDMLNLYNSWHEYQDLPQDFMRLRYEDLVTDTLSELDRVIHFLGLEVREEILVDAIKASRFDNMSKFDNRAFKFRSGKGFDFQEELGEEDLKWIENRLKGTLNPGYGYT